MLRPIGLRDKQKRTVSKLKFYKSRSVSIRGAERRLTIEDSRGGTQIIRLHRYALLGKGDRVVIDPEKPKSIFAASSEDDADRIRIAPPFSSESSRSLGKRTFKFKVKEITDEADRQDFEYLERFHYKSAISDDDSSSSKLSSGGRKAVLLAFTKEGGVRTPAGYIELQMPLLMAKPRHTLFGHGFSHPSRPISWDTWDQHAMRKHVNCIVRIARVVVHPELRGLGISRLLIDQAKQYSRERWHIGGVRPLFMEISAEMLNHIDFVGRSGFRLAGNTEGNISRVVRDLVSMSRGYEVTSGIMSLQKKYLTVLLRYCEETGSHFDDVLSRLQEITKSDNPAGELNPLEWVIFGKVLRFPIPYYICGLDGPSQEFVERHLPPPSVRENETKLGGAKVEVRGLEIASDYEVSQTESSRIILNCFGIQGARLKTKIVSRIDIEASAGNVILIAGSSGTGKTALLSALDSSKAPSSTSLLIDIKSTNDYMVQWLSPLPSDGAIFDILAERSSVKRALGALSEVGLSEAFALVKPFNLLSRGQQYRAMLANLLLGDASVWLIDEFCSDLDPLTARIVAHSLRKHVNRVGRIAFVAAANHGHFIDALNPSRVIYLRLGGEVSQMSYKEYNEDYIGFSA